MRKIPPSVVEPSHRDYAPIMLVVREILDRAGGIDALRRNFPPLLRQAIDEVIDAPRTGRFRIDELEKTEKTYIGTKVEILLRDYLRLQKGVLDLDIQGLDVDIKNTVGGNWMIPKEAVNKHCVLVAADEESTHCYLGVFIARPEHLSSHGNRDEKRSISSAGLAHIHWLLREEPYPAGFWRFLNAATIRHINDTSVGGAVTQAAHAYGSASLPPETLVSVIGRGKPWSSVALKYRPIHRPTDQP